MTFDYTTDLSAEMRLWLIILACFSSAQSSYCQDGFVKGQPKLAYWQIGNKAETVIVLHGGPDVTHDYLRPEFDKLSQAAKVVYYDQRGIGKSGSAANYNWQTQVEDLDRVIKTFSTRKVFLAASSWGTTLAILYTYFHPENIKGLLLSGTYQWPGKGRIDAPYQAYIQQMDSLRNARAFFVKQVKPIKQPPLKETRFKFYEQRQLIDQAEIKRRGYPTITVEKEVIRVGTSDTAELVYSLVTAPVLDSIATIKVPILLFNGSWKNCHIDWAHRYVKLFAQAELYTIPAACHDPWLSDPQKFFTKSVDFIRGIIKNQP